MSRPYRPVFPLLLAAAATIALYHLPFAWFLARPLVWLATFSHEMGHGLAALFLGGVFESFRMWVDGSGIAQTSYPASAFRSALVSAGGLLGPAVAAGGLFLMSTRPRLARLGLSGLGFLFLASVLLVVRNLFGIAFCASAGLLILVLARLASDREAQVGLLFLAIQLSLSVFSSSGYLFSRFADTAGGRFPSDTSQIASALGGVYWAWGLVVGAVSVTILLGGIATYWRFGGSPLLDPLENRAPQPEG